MHISVCCPRCHGRYHVEETLRGRQMRCPSPVCRAVFEVREAETDEGGSPPEAGKEPASGPQATPAVPPETGEAQILGSVGELVPILPAEEVGEDAWPYPHRQPPPPSPAPSAANVQDIVPVLPAEAVYTLEPESRREAPSWREPPPVRVPPTTKPEEPAAQRSPRRHLPGTPPKSPGSREESPQAAEIQPPSSVPPGPESPPAKPVRSDAASPAPDTPVLGGDSSGRLQAADQAAQSTGAPPIELGPGAWAAPPVRRPGGEMASGAAPEASPQPVVAPGPTGDQETDALPVAATRRWGKKVMAVMLLLGLGVAAGAVVLILTLISETQGELYEKAKVDYEAARYHDATTRFDALQKGYPDSPRLAEYRFFADLSAVRDELAGITPRFEKAFTDLQTFLKGRESDPLVKEHYADLWQTFHPLIGGLTQSAKGQLDTPVKARDTLDKSKQALAMAKKWIPREIRSGRKLNELQDEIDQAAQAIAKAERRQDLLAQIPAGEASVDKLEGFEKRTRQEGLADDPKVQELLDQLRASIRAGITFEHLEAPLAAHSIVPDTEPSLIIGPDGVPPATNEGVVFALARGVLYALAEKDGTVLWATRVGIDTLTLPVRLPTSDIPRETVLVLSSDTNTLTARDAFTGEVRWAHDLKSPSLGRPVLVERKAYMATVDGKVHEIETFLGTLIGWYKLGIPLTVGGVWQPGTHLLYVPADRRYVYVLDVAPLPRRPAKPCVAILQSNHPAGSLRSEPIIISREALRRDKRLHLPPGKWPDYLVLSQTDGLRAMKMQVFPLPIPSAAGVQQALWELPIPGWPWFAPYHDSEKLAQVTDTATLSIIGVKQVGNEDDPLFPDLQQALSGEGDAGRTERAQIVHVQEDDYWVLARGALQRLHFDKFRQEVLPVWRQAVALGSPLHASQVDRKGKTLFLVTQSLSQQTCLATAVNAEDGAIIWQRQLGLLGQGDPVVIGQSVLALDQGGQFFEFDPAQPQRRLFGPWRIGGRAWGKPLLTLPSPKLGGEEGGGRPILISADQGPAAYAISWRDAGGQKQLTVRRYDAAQNWSEKIFEGCPGPVGGTPALAGDTLVLPLAAGVLWRQPLQGDPAAGSQGPAWRAREADEDSLGHVLALGQDQFLVTDGSAGLKRLHWPAGEANWKDLETVQTPTQARIVSAPLLLPRDLEEAETRVLLADADGNLILLRAQHLLERPLRTWKLQGKITAGPFLRGGHIGCIVNQRRLVWLHPERQQPLWSYQTPGESIVGQPQLVGDMILVADMNGTFIGLNPATGQPRWQPGYKLRANVAPAAAPVAFGRDEAFAPLSDGTVLLLPLRQLRPPFRDFAPLW